MLNNTAISLTRRRAAGMAERVRSIYAGRSAASPISPLSLQIVLWWVFFPKQRFRGEKKHALKCYPNLRVERLTVKGRFLWLQTKMLTDAQVKKEKRSGVVWGERKTNN